MNVAVFLPLQCFGRVCAELVLFLAKMCGRVYQGSHLNGEFSLRQILKVQFYFS